MNITEFFKTDFNNYAMYDSFRSIASYVDGLKPSARKVLHVVGKNNIKTPLKVSQLCSKVAEETEYLHGENSLVGVVCGLAQDFPGTNNINLLIPEGSFGTRTIQEPSAPRYIFTCKNKSFDHMFNSDDIAILEEQWFEGTKIEPRYFAPVLPLILVNGSEGIGTGFAQKILPRNPKELISQLKSFLTSGKSDGTLKGEKLVPFYKGFKGRIERDPEAQNWKIYGSFEKLSQTTLAVTELPIGYDLEDWKKVLDALEEKKIIQGYTDESADSKFLTKIKVTREFLAAEDEKIFDKLKLIKRVSENFTCIDEDNTIREFETLEQVMVAYTIIRLSFYRKRKEYLLDKLQRELDILNNRAKFIFYIIKGMIVINNKPRKDIESQCETQKLIAIDGKFDYLTNMPIYSLSKEKLTELKETIIKKESEVDRINNMTERDMWLEDIKELEKHI